MKGQAKVVSLILIILIATAAIAMVLPWAYNMIEKKEDMKDLDDAYNFFETMDSTIRNIAQNGGEESLRLKIPGKFEIYPDSLNNALNNSIVFRIEGKVSFIAVGDWIPLNTPNTNTTATLGIDPPSVVFGKAERDGNKLIIQHRLWYRQLNDTKGNLYKIVLNTADNNLKTSTTGFLKIQRLGSETIAEKSLTIIKINIIV
jgi:hypothetical protein